MSQVNVLKILVGILIVMNAGLIIFFSTAREEGCLRAAGRRIFGI